MFTRFLWSKDNQQSSPANIKIVRFARVPLDMISSSALLGGTIVHHLDQNEHKQRYKPKKYNYLHTSQTKYQRPLRRSQENHSQSMNLQDWKSDSKEFNKGQITRRNKITWIDVES